YKIVQSDDTMRTSGRALFAAPASNLPRPMHLAQVMPAALAGAQNLEITSLAYDARAVVPGTLFFCVPGFTRDGHEFAPEAIERGAVALVVERQLDLDTPQIQVESVRQA